MHGMAFTEREDTGSLSDHVTMDNWLNILCFMMDYRRAMAMVGGRRE